MRRITQPKQKLALTAVAAGAALLVWLLQLPCIYRLVLGGSCPGCGMTRAVAAALRLDFAAAFRCHRMFWSIPVAYLYFLFDGRVLGVKWLDRAVLWALAAGFLFNWLFPASI
jgi:hypothetical protein